MKHDTNMLLSKALNFHLTFCHVSHLLDNKPVTDNLAAYYKLKANSLNGLICVFVLFYFDFNISKSFQLLIFSPYQHFSHLEKI